MREQLQPPADLNACPLGRDESEPTFADLDPESQRALIGEYVSKNPEQVGLFGEAINEHALSASIVAAFLANDLDCLATRVDRAIREYIGDVIDRDSDF